MSDNVLVPMSGDNAQALLDAAGDEPEQVSVVSHGSDGLNFSVPSALAKKAKVDTLDPEPDAADQVKADQERLAGYNDAVTTPEDVAPPEQAPDEAPAKKAAKKAPAKKAAKKSAKKTAAKKTAKK